MLNIGRKHGLDAGGKGIRDAIIITGFWKNNINVVHVRDRAFEKTCEELGLNVLRFPTNSKEFIVF